MSLTHSCAWYEWKFAKKFYGTYAAGKRWSDLTDLSSVARARGLANVAALYATKYIYTHSISDKNECTELIDDVNNHYSHWGSGTGTHRWTSPLASYPLMLAAWIIDEYAGTNKKSDIQSNMTSELDHWESYNNGNPESGYVDDTKAESNGWTAAALYLGGCIWNDSGWKDAGKKWAYFTLCYSSDSYAGTTGIQTIYSSGSDANMVDNHCCHPSPPYAYASISMLARCQLARWLIEGETDILPEFTHRLDDVWDKHWDYVDTSNWKWNSNWSDTNCSGETCRTTHGQDEWGNDMRCFNDAFAFKYIVSGQSYYDDLLEFENGWFDGNYTVYIEYNDGYNYSDNNKWYFDAIFMFRHLIAYWIDLQNAPRLYIRFGNNMWYFKPDGVD